MNGIPYLYYIRRRHNVHILNLQYDSTENGLTALITLIYRAPTSLADSIVRQQWVDKISAYQEYKAYGYNTKIRLCQLHFDPEHIKEGRYRLELTKGTVPTIFPERIQYVSLSIFKSI